MESDSPLQRVRKARMAISAECNYDPQKLVEYYMKLQERHRDRLVCKPETPTADKLSDSPDKNDI
jgi:hypothetical protein